MDPKIWKENLLKYIKNIKEVSDLDIKNILEKDNMLLQCVSKMFQMDNTQNIVILYGEYSWFLKASIKTNILCVDILEGKQINQIKWVDFNNPYNDIFQLSYLVFDDEKDPLYEFKLICQQYNFNYDIKNLVIKCVVDNRKENNHNLLIENRSGIKIQSIIY